MIELLNMDCYEKLKAMDAGHMRFDVIRLMMEKKGCNVMPGLKGRLNK